MPLQQHIPFFSILIPIITAILIFFIKNNKLIKKITFISLTIIALMSIALVIYFQVSLDNSFRYVMGHFSAPWGIELKATAMEAVLSLTFTIVMIFSLAGGLKGIESDIKDRKQKYYYMMTQLILASLFTLIYTNDIFTAYVFMEINTIAACFIVVAKENGETIRATIKYFIMSVIGSGLYLFATATLYGITGNLSMEYIHIAIQELTTHEQYIFPLTISLILIIVAVAIKSALFPFHTWLPDAHSSGTKSSSAILSGLVLKGYIILLIKILYRVFGIEVVTKLKVLPLILTLGILGMVLGSIFAILQKDIKKMLAYSTVSQIGYVFMGIGIGTTTGVSAAIFHIITHAVSKAALFLTAGAVVDVTNNKNINNMKGIGALMPITMGIFTICGLSMIGVPPLAGFGSKWNLGVSIMNSNYGWTIAFLALSTLLNTSYYIPIIMRAFFRMDPEEAKVEKRLEGSKIQLLPVICLGILVIIIGLNSGSIFDIIANGITYF